MNIQKKIKLLGYISIGIGSIAALLCIYPSARSLLIALPVGFIGMVCSSIYVFMDMKYELNTKKITPGIIGLLLSSTPVLLILSIIIIKYFNS